MSVGVAFVATFEQPSVNPSPAKHPRSCARDATVDELPILQELET